MKNLTLIGDQEAQLSYQSDLIMLHSDAISAQWSPNNTGLTVMKTSELVKLGFTTVSRTGDSSVSRNYQSFHFVPENYDEIKAFFSALGFPEHCFTEIPTIEA